MPLVGWPPTIAVVALAASEVDHGFEAIVHAGDGEGGEGRPILGADIAACEETIFNCLNFKSEIWSLPDKAASWKAQFPARHRPPCAGAVAYSGKPASRIPSIIGRHSASTTPIPSRADSPKARRRKSGAASM